MHIELAPEVEATLAAEASRNGLTTQANQERILSEHARSLIAAALPPDRVADICTPAQGREWILSRNPDLRRARAGQVDWRREVHEGHRY